MTKLSLSKILTLFFRLLLIFTLIFIWARYYSANLRFSVLVSLLITLCIEIIINLLKKKANAKNFKTLQEQKKADAIANTFMVNTKVQNLNFFIKLLQKKYSFQKVTKQSSCVLVEKQNQSKVAFVPYFTHLPFGVDDLIKVMQSADHLQASKIVVCTKSTVAEAVNFAKMQNVEIVILEKNQVYLEILKKQNFFPEPNPAFKFEAKTKQLKFKDLITAAISPKRTRSYFFSSLALLVATYFVPYNIYYIIFSSLLLILCLASFSSSWWQKKTKQSIF